MKTIETISNAPFRHLISTIGELPTSFTESMSYYEMLAWLCDFIEKKVVPVVDANAEALIELQEYVVHYFDNLDVQAEIDHKLDEMAESGELAEIIAQYLELSSVLAFDTINALKGADNLIDGSTVRVLGNSDAYSGDGAYYKIRELDPSDVIDDYNKVGLDNFDSLVAVRLPDYEVNLLWNGIYRTRKNEFNSIKLTPTIFYEQQSTVSYQGCCVYNNTLYQYENLNSVNGNIYKFNLISHQFIEKMENVPLYHGNSLACIEGTIYAAACLNNTTPINYISVYNLNSGTSDQLSPFDSSYIAKTVCVTDYNNKLLVGGMSDGAASDLSSMNFALLNLSNETYVEYSLVNPNHFNLSDNVVAEMVYADDKLYILTDSNNLLFEASIDDNEHTVTINKVTIINNLDITGLEVGELEGMSMIPSEYYGENSFVITSAILGATGNETTLQVYIGNLHGDIPAFSALVNNKLSPRRVQNIYVKKSGGSSLIEDGSETNPFRSLIRAISFANNAKARGLTIDQIMILDSETYTIGSLTNTEFYINTSTYTPTIKIKYLSNCNAAIIAQTNVNIEKTSDVDNIFIDGNSDVYLDKATVKSPVVTNRNSSFVCDNLTVTISAQDWLLLQNSFARLNITSATGFSRNLINNRRSSLCLINSAYSANVYTDTNASLIVGTA